MKKFLLGLTIGAVVAGGLVGLASHRYSVLVVSHHLRGGVLCRIDHWTGRTWHGWWFDNDAFAWELVGEAKGGTSAVTSAVEPLDLRPVGKEPLDLQPLQEESAVAADLPK